ncbi:hypothetical protein EYR41_011793 [Orbilia oligospora]|uniref:Cleavage and polyadenylation specificity factor subunit 2 n=1 Tax=Orbilia oligospora TaxID=2813651 RepID=A0A7C8PG00_ORBOL|nr:hypothetical protein TWF751_003085 [Orbilia oligospora]TGJ62604.1 hypothetical protein EYR41_011793 [Orbilia oligospora]
MFQFIPLLGAQSASRASASLLLLDNGIKILVDCGWSEPFNVDDLQQIEKHAPTISLILLTHPTISHIGSYAHCCAHIPHFSRIPVYCTYPVANLGRSLLQDAYLSTPLITSTYPPTSDLSPLVLRNPPSSDDIDRYFDSFSSLKYSQPFTFPSPPLAGLTITAYRAGHTLGGTIWRIQHSHSSENILYAVSWNHLRDAHLSSASFLPGPTGVSEEFLNPTALICSPYNCLPGQVSTPRKKRDELLLSAIRKAAFAGGTVLIPTDSSARILELAYLLEHDFRSKSSNWGSSGATISLAVRTAGRTFRYVRALLEWMDESMVKEFESVTHNNNPSSRRKPKSSNTGAGDKEDDKLYGPFDFRHLKLVEHKHQLTKILSRKGGKVVITSDKSLEWGFSTEVVKSVADDERNLIVLTERGSEGTAGGYLYKKWRELCLPASKKEEIGDASIMGQVVKLDNVLLDMNVGLKIPLNESELQAHNEFLKQQQLSHDIKDAEISLLETAENIAGAVNADDDDDIAGVSSSSDEEDEDEDPTLQGKSLSTGIQARKAVGGGGIVDEGINVLMKGKGVHDWDVRHAKGRNRMFPFSVQRRKFDDYGEVVRVEDFVKAEEDVATVGGTAGVQGEKIEFLGGRGSGVVLPGMDEEGGIGRKRKWDKVSTTANKRGGNTHASKKLKQGRRGRERSLSVESEDGQISESDESDDYEPEDVTSTTSGVCKLVINTTTVMLKNNLVFIDYSGLSDGRSLRMLLPQLKPKKVVLIGGTIEETEVLGKEVEGMMEKERRKLRVDNDDDEEEREREVFMPKIGEAVNVGGETEVWSLKLSDGLVKMLKWQSVGGLGVVHVVGRVTVDTSTDLIKPENIKDEDTAMKTEEEEPDKKRQLVLDILPTSTNTPIKSAKPIHVGDIKLPELRRVLLDAGHTAELTGEGRLLCDGVVSVVKEGVGRVTIEDVGGSGGLLSGRGKGKGRFWEVRRLVYEGLARVSGN